MQEVITFTPTRQVITFNTYEDATKSLLPKFHDQIIKSADELAKKYDMQSLHWMITLSMGLKKAGADCPVDNLLNIKDRFKLAQRIWPMLIVHGKKVKNTALNKKVANPMGIQKTAYWTDYVPGEDEVRDLLYIQLRPQVRQLVDIIIDVVLPAGELGVPEYRLYKALFEGRDTGKLLTRQDPWLIWKYYENLLKAQHFINIDKTREERKIK